MLLSSPYTQGEAELPQAVGKNIFQQQDYASCQTPPFFRHTKRRVSFKACMPWSNGQDISSRTLLKLRPRHTRPAVSQQHIFICVFSVFALYLQDVYLGCHSTSRTHCAPQNALTWLQTTEIITSLSRGRAQLPPGFFLPAGASLEGSPCFAWTLGVPQKLPPSF